jgi:hypothetical protein
MPVLLESTESWWNGSLRGRPKIQRRSVAAILMCTAWNIWKERNKRIFQGQFTTPSRVFHLIKEELRLRVLGMGSRVGAANV